MYLNKVIAVIVPCYRVKEHVIEKVINKIPAWVDHILCIDDCCPCESGNYIKASTSNDRVVVFFNVKNTGVGGAVLRGYIEALKLGADIFVKIDGDGQMDPTLIPNFIKPICLGLADYSKGNRFFNTNDATRMPFIRWTGNIALSFFTKASSGYYGIFDPTNGYTAIHSKIAASLEIEKIANRYFFESDILFRLGLLHAKVIDVPMKAVYEDEKSSLKIYRILHDFLLRHLLNLLKRLYYNYIWRDFNFGTVTLLSGVILALFSVFYGLSNWGGLFAKNEPATAGTVMLAALPAFISFQLLLAFIREDIHKQPNTPIHPFLN